MQLDLGGGSATQVSGNRVPAAIKCPNMGIQIEDDLGCAAAKIYGNGDQGPPPASEPGNGFFIIDAEAMDCDPSAGDVPAGQHGRLGVQKVHKTHVKPKSGLSKPSGGQRMSVVKQARAPPPLRSVDDVDMQFRDLLKSQGKVRRKSVHPAYRYPVTLIHTPGRSGKIFLELFCGHATCASGTVRRLLDSVNFVACETHSLTAAPQGYAAMGLDIRQGVDLTCPRVQSCVCQWIAKGHVVGETCQCCCGPSALDRQDGSQCSILLGCLRSG